MLPQLSHTSDPFVSTRYRNARGFVVKMVVPNRAPEAISARFEFDWHPGTARGDRV